MKMVPQPDIYTREKWNVNRNDPDTIQHQFGKLMTQYKSIVSAVLHTFRDAASDKVYRKRYAYGATGNLARVAALSTVLGALTIAFGDIARGRSPRDMDRWDFLLEAMMRGGALGIMADFVLGSHNEERSGFLGGFTGPVISGPGYDAAKAVRQLLLLEPGESWENTVKAFKKLTPSISGLTVLLNTAFLDSWGALSGSPELVALRKARAAEMGSEYYFD